MAYDDALPSASANSSRRAMQSASGRCSAPEEPHVRPMDFTGRPMKTTVYIDSDGTAGDDDLAGWVDAGADFAAALPPKG